MNASFDVARDLIEESLQIASFAHTSTAHEEIAFKTLNEALAILQSANFAKADGEAFDFKGIEGLKV